MDDLKYMEMALSLAARGRGMTHPNPMVGAVLVKNGEVAGKGYHKGPGGPHAEIEALREAGEQADGSDLYVTLEPCNHEGRTPPCTEAILRAGVQRVVMAANDPNPSVKGGGEERLRGAGLRVDVGLMKEKALELNAAYEKFVLTGKPMVTVKVAITADGKVAARGGNSKWITGEEARKMVHRMRRECDAVMIGSGTLAADDPELTVRMVPLGAAKPPLRVVVDSRLSLRLDSRLAEGGEPQVIAASTASCDAEKAEVLRRRGVEVLIVGDDHGRVDLEELLEVLGRRGVVHLLVEGGPTLTTSFFMRGLVDRLALFVAPKVFGDEKARSWMEGRIVSEPMQALSFKWARTRRLGEDIMLEAVLERR